MSEHGAHASVVCQVLGALAIRGAEGNLIEVTAEKPRRLLAELVLHADAWVETERLTEALWATPPASAKGNIKTYVHQLRQLLPEAKDGAARLLSRRGSYRLVLATDELDAGLFASQVAEGRAQLQRGDVEDAVHTLREALALWAGEPYTQVPSAAAELETARLHELRKVALDSLADALTAAGQPAEAAAVLRPLTAQDPLREATWRRLLTALRADGRPADALVAYQEMRRALVEELGAEPGQELRALHKQLLAETQDDEHEGRDGAVPAPAAAGPRRRHAGLRERVAAGFTRRTFALAVVCTLVVAGSVFVLNRMLESNTPRANADTTGSAAVTMRRTVPGYPLAPGQPPKLLFGLGSEAAKAAESELVATGNVGMLSTWFDDPDELVQYEAWGKQVVPQLYRQGKALHLVVPSWDETRAIRTRYGPACGQPYPLSDRFLGDMARLARAFAGRADGPPLYVSMFHGLEKLACSELGYDVDPLNRNYYRALKDRYLDVVRVFHANAPNARVALNWDGWEATHDDPANGDGRSMFGYFADEMKRSDFTSFSAFEPGDNVEDIRATVHELGKYGPVMLSYYKPYGDPPVDNRTFQHDLSTVFTDANLRKLTDAGLFAWGFTDDELIGATRASYRLTERVLDHYGRSSGSG